MPTTFMKTTIESEKNAAAEAPQRKPKRKPAKHATPTKRMVRAKQSSSKPKEDRANKKAGIIALMKRAKGATLAEIMKATGWQPHTVFGFPRQRRETIESSKNGAGATEHFFAWLSLYNRNRNHLLSNSEATAHEA
jgi:Protein of unknown function (DUF3489)